MDHRSLMEEINSLSEVYESLSINGIGESIFGRSIPMITLGEGKKQVIYLGAQSGRDFCVSFALLKFIKEYCALQKSGGKIFGLPIDYIKSKISILVIPMLNPDGVEYCLNGVGEDNPIKDRLIGMNDGCDDYSNWCANARGVDLRRNYNCGFLEYKSKMEEKSKNGAPSGYCGENSESEPEIGAFCNFLRYSNDIGAVIELSAEGKKLEYVSSPKNDRVARAISDMIGCGIKTIDVNDCTLCSWCANEIFLPCFSVGCDLKDINTSAFVLYARLRRMLFCTPMLF